MAALAVPSQVELAQLSKPDLIAAVQAAVKKIQSQGSRIKKLGAQTKAVVQSEPAQELMDYGSAAISGAGVGMWMGSIQRKILDGEEGYTEDSLSIGGVPMDLAAALAGGATAYMLSRSDKTAPYARFAKGGALGALGAALGRMGYESALAPDEEQEGAEGGEQAA
ncbi:MAG: hypothetical protein K0V04_15575 [Deltaproteobacteria bacterium]|nr:hypothetical protein [Deltaproteobacteria bacterium]